MYNLLWQYLERNVEFSDSGKWGIIESNGDKIILLIVNHLIRKRIILLITNNIEMLVIKKRIDNGLNYTLHRVRSSVWTRRR